MHTTIIQPVINSHVISGGEGVALTEPVKIAKNETTGHTLHIGEPKLHNYTWLKDTLLNQYSGVVSSIVAAAASSFA